MNVHWTYDNVPEHVSGAADSRQQQHSDSNWLKIRDSTGDSTVLEKLSRPIVWAAFARKKFALDFNLISIDQTPCNV